MAPQLPLTAVGAAALEALEELAERCTLSATCSDKQRGFSDILGGGDHLKGLPLLSHVERVVGYRSVVADGA